MLIVALLPAAQFTLEPVIAEVGSATTSNRAAIFDKSAPIAEQ